MAVIVFDLEEVIAAVVTPVPTAGRGALPPYGVSESDTEADPRAKHAEGTLPRHCGSQPNRRQQSPPAIAFPRPDQGRPHFRRRLAQGGVMSKSAPSERSLRVAGGNQAELDITSLCESAGPPRNPGRPGPGKGAGGWAVRYGPGPPD